jgi:PAS domain S-box-containing protein
MGFHISLYLSNLRLRINSRILRLLKVITLTTVLIFSIVLILPTNAYAEDSNPQFDKFTVDDGLSQSCVFVILQDSQGFMWFGTQDGLNKYDGYNLTVYKYNELDSSSLSDNFIESIYEDKSGAIWIGTESGGLNKFERKTEQFTHYRHNPENPNSLGNNTVLSIYEDKFGTLWVGTADGGLNQFNRETEQFTRYTHNPDDPNSLSSNTVLSIYEDRFGTLWFGTDGGGLNKFNRETEQFTYYTHIPDDPKSLSNDTVLSIYEDQSGRLWIGTNGGGLNKFDRNNGHFIHYLHEPDNPNSLSDNTVSSIVEDRFGNLWLATSSWYDNSYGTALNKFVPATEQFTHYTHDPANPNSLSDNIVPSILIDNSENLWIGTGFGGINKLDTKNNKFTHYKQDIANPHSLIDNHISSIYEAQNGTLWIGTYNKGLDKIDRRTEQFTHYTYEPNNENSLSSNNIWSIYEDHSGVLWIGTLSGGLNQFDLETGKFIHYKYDPNNSNSLSDDTVWSIYEDKSGTLWIGTFHGGLNKFDRETGKFTHYTHNPDNPKSLSDNSVFSIYEDESGMLWIGTINGGLNKFNRETGEFTHYTHDSNNLNSLSYDRVLSMYEYPAGTLWIGTYGGGLDKFDISTETFTHYTENDGLPNNSVVGILADDEGNLWLSTGKGLSKFNPKTETFRNYDVSDGLQGNEFDGVKAYFKSKTGEMFFGGLNGFNAFYPEQVKDNPHIPPIVITDFKIFDKSVKLGTAISETQELKLSYKDNFFGFEFAALDYTNPQKNQYAYKLEGFDKDWIYSGSRRYATYTNLDGGTYIFRAKGSNNDGVWNEEGTSIKIIITPPPWKTWWAYTLYLIALVSAIYGYVQWKTRAQAKENALLRENERRLHQFLEAIPLGINVIDTTGKVVYFNQAALKIYGRESSSDASIKNCLEVYPQLYIAGTKQPYPLEDLPLMRALRGEKRIVDDLEIHQSDKIIPVEVWGTPIYDEQGTILYATVAFQDITHRKQAETERQEYIEALRVSLREKEVLLKEVHHRVKNNLQIICSLLDLQSQNLTDQKTLDVFRNSYNRVRSMAIIHEKLYQSTSLEKIDFVDYVETLTYYLFQSYSTSSDFIKININLEPIFLNLDTAIPCGLIINELLSNALKHAFPQLNEGCIELNFKSDTSQKFILIVKDNGIGFANDFDIQKNSNLGLQLVKLLTQQLEGDLEFNQSQGSEFKIKFEVKA